MGRLNPVRVAALAIVVLAAASLAFAPVRSLASELLRVFRVERVETISLTQEDLTRISESLSAGNGHVDLEALGDVWTDGSPEFEPVSLAEAREELDFDVRLPDGMDARPAYALQRAASMRFKLHVDEVNELLRMYGGEHLLPESVDGKEFTVRLAPVLMATYADDAEECGPGTVVVQTRGPELSLPEGVSALELRDVLVNLPMLPEKVRRQLAGLTDWQHTLVIPDVDGTSRKTRISGVDAVIVGDPDAPYRGVVWNDGGVIRGVGAADEKSAVAIAASLMK